MVLCCFVLAFLNYPDLAGIMAMAMPPIHAKSMDIKRHKSKAVETKHCDWDVGA